MWTFIANFVETVDKWCQKHHFFMYCDLQGVIVGSTLMEVGRNGTAK